MNKENIFFLALLAIVVLIFATFSVFAFQKEEKLPIITDAMKIKEEFALPNTSSSINVSLEDENSFKYISSENALHLLKNESGNLQNVEIDLMITKTGLLESFNKGISNEKYAVVPYLDKLIKTASDGKIRNETKQK